MNISRRLYLRTAWLLMCTAMGIALILRNDPEIGLGLLAGGIIGGSAELIRCRSRREMRKNGEVPYDERDLLIAGRAAVLTLRITLAAMGVGFLALVLIAPTWSPAILPTTGILIGLMSLLYSLSYRILRRRG